MTDQEKKEYRQLIQDLTLFSSTMEELQDKMTSKSGQTFMKQFVAQALPAVKQMKAVCLVELGEV